MNLLYLVHRTPYPPNRGDRIRSYHLLRFLAARHRVYLACLADEPTPASDRAALDALCEQVAVVPLGRRTRWLRAAASLARGRSATEGLFASPGLRKIVEEWARETRFDAAIAFCSSMTPYLKLPSLAKVPAIIDLVDVDSQKWFDYAAISAGFKRNLFECEGRRVRSLEQEAAVRCSALLAVSESEAELCRPDCDPTPVYAIPNGVDLDYFNPPRKPDETAEAEPECVFVGALDYRANVDGMVWFCREVWPLVRRRHPNAKLVLVGRNPAAAVRRLTQLPGVSVVADVPDVRPFLARATAVIAPLRVARGLQNKVLEALAAGQAVVASTGALEGIDLQPGLHALRADSPAEWAASIARLFEDRDYRERLGAAGRSFVEQRHDWTTQLQPLDAILSRCSGGETAPQQLDPIPAGLACEH